MSNYLLALEYIAPSIGGGVIAGTVSFLGGILLARKQSHNLRVERGKLTAPLLEAEIARLHQERRQSELEDEMFDAFSSQRTVFAAFGELLNRIVPPNSTRFAAWIGDSRFPECSQTSRGLSDQSFHQTQVPDQLLRRLVAQNPLVIHRDSDELALFQCLDKIDREKTSTLYLTAIDDGREHFGVLITSGPWLDGHSEIERQVAMKRVARRIGHRCHQLQMMELQSNELRLTQEMLELRAIIDSLHVQSIETLQRFVKRLHRSTHADRVAIYFVARRQGEELRPVVECGHSATISDDPAWYQHEQALARTAIETGLANLQDRSRCTAWPGQSPIGAVAAIPIRVNDRVLGVLCVTREGRAKSFLSDQKLIEFSAATLSNTIGRVFEEASVRKQARQDHLTDLANRRSFDDFLTTVIERVQSKELSHCSLILADLDRFKSINDQFGHQAGDEVLRTTARILSAQIADLRLDERSLVTRYGGEEFAILLPGVRLADAASISERIRSAVGSTPVTFKGQQLNITISLGVAACPDAATTVDSLVAAADKALYQAKAQGRNRVCRLSAVQASSLGSSSRPGLTKSDGSGGRSR